MRLVGEEAFELLKILFAVTGNSPVTMYNQIKITQPLVNGQAAQYEYKIVPRGSGDMRSFDDEQEVFRLGAGVLKSRKSLLQQLETCETASYGTFTVQAEGKVITKKMIIHNPELFRNFKILKLALKMVFLKIQGQRSYKLKIFSPVPQESFLRNKRGEN